ncbi:MAG: 4Fe-4S dicluster domain-containing protein [Candidatus Omnitrophica bacterium]|nr:4Fe-4S dicluster domain-containing protein [Candidatus Omnitrophota bacterium]
MKYPKLRELKEAIKAIIKGPYTTEFPFKPHKPFERFRGKPEFHEENCIGCGACHEVCPAKAIEMSDVGNKRILAVHWDLCIFCDNCQVNCLTEKGIMLSDKFDVSTTEKKEELKQEISKELVLCEGCGKIIAPYDQIIWVAEKLGPLVFSNASLMHVYLNEKKILEKKEVLKKEEFLRSDRIRILCPVCRREVVLKS